jgi:hypothetical protein
MILSVVRISRVQDWISSHESEQRRIRQGVSRMRHGQKSSAQHMMALFSCKNLSKLYMQALCSVQLLRLQILVDLKIEYFTLT